MRTYDLTIQDGAITVKTSVEVDGYEVEIISAVNARTGEAVEVDQILREDIENEALEHDARELEETAMEAAALRFGH